MLNQRRFTVYGGPETGRPAYLPFGGASVEIDLAIPFRNRNFRKLHFLS